MMTNSSPKAKTDRLIVREIDSETLVYNRGRDRELLETVCREGLARVRRQDICRRDRRRGGPPKGLRISQP
jgi:hypothetical protein